MNITSQEKNAIPSPRCGDCGKDHIGALVSQASRSIRRALDSRVAAEVTPELSGVRSMLLGEIVRANNENRDLYQRDVEKWLHLQRSSVTAILQSMEQDGFITRCSVQRDARLKKLQATPKGVAYHSRICETIDRYENDLQQGLTEQELAAMRTGLEILLRNAQAITEAAGLRKE